MKRIKIKPFPNSKISEDCHENDVKSNSIPIKKEFIDSIPDTLSLIAEFKDGNKRVLRANVVEDECGIKYISVSPNLVQLYLDSALEFYYESEVLKNISFPNCACKKDGQRDDLKILDIDTDSTHQCYDNFIKKRVLSIIMLSTSIESFCNHIIPNDYVFVRTETNFCSGAVSTKTRSKKRIEKEVKLRDKIDQVIPEFTDNDFWLSRIMERNCFEEIYKLRNSLVHLKTEGKTDLDVYSEQLKQIINSDILLYIQSVIKIFNEISNLAYGVDFIEFISNDYSFKFDENKIDFDFIYFFFKIEGGDMYSFFNKKFNISKSKFKKWENKFPEEAKKFFIDSKGNSIYFLANNFMQKYKK